MLLIKFFKIPIKKLMGEGRVGWVDGWRVGLGQGWVVAEGGVKNHQSNTMFHVLL